MFFKQDLGLMAQGFQRDMDASSKVVPLKSPHEKLLVNVDLFRSICACDVHRSSAVLFSKQDSCDLK